MKRDQIGNFDGAGGKTKFKYSVKYKAIEEVGKIAKLLMKWKATARNLAFDT